MGFFSIYLLIGCVWMFILHRINDILVMEEFRIKLGILEILIGMLIWPLSLFIFIRSILTK